MPELYLFPSGEPDWGAMLGGQHGRPPKQEDLEQEARKLYNLLVRDGLAQCDKCGEVVELDFSATEKRAGGKSVICRDCKGHFWLSTSGETAFFSKGTDQYGQPRQLRQIQ